MIILRSYMFKPKLGMSVFCVFFIGLFCLLSIWQHQRYFYKKSLLSVYQERLAATPQPFIDVIKKPDFLFKKIYVTGHYLNNLTILMPNQFYHDHLGFEVLTPLQIPGNNKLLLIDRGWVEKSNYSSLPYIKALYD